jgi:hypothetical protein
VSIDAPNCRATIRDGVLTLNPWSPALLGNGPEPAGVRTVTAAPADLRFGDDELIVAPVPRTPWSDEAEDVILRWAPSVGYRRVWLPERVVDFDSPAPLGHASVDCPSCGARWEDASPGFWAHVRACGWFPARCPACGGSLPEWTVDADGGDLPVSERAAPQRLDVRG